MSYFKSLTGPRVYLSPMRVEDAEIYCRWLNDPAVTEKLGMSGKGNMPLESERKWITENGDRYQYAIVHLSDDVLLGNCGFNKIDALNQSAEVGVFLGDESQWNKGYGAEALGLLVTYGFRQLNLHSIYLHVFGFNARAMACYCKLGFTECGRRHESHYINGAWQDEVTMELLRDDWAARI